MLTLSAATIASLRVAVTDNTLSLQNTMSFYYRNVVSDIGTGVEHFLLENARFPDDLDELFAAKPELAGFRDVASYAMFTFSDTQIDRLYQKAFVYIKADRDQADAEWFSGNSCGSDPAVNPDVPFCKNDGSVYAQLDNRQYQLYLASETIVRLDYLGQQLFNGRTSRGVFPGNTSDNTAIADGAVVTLANAVGFTDAPEQCGNVFHFDGAVISCEFLFSLTGSPVYYIRENDSNVVLYVDLPVFHANGEPHRIARPLRVL